MTTTTTTENEVGRNAGTQSTRKQMDGLDAGTNRSADKTADPTRAGKGLLPAPILDPRLHLPPDQGLGNLFKVCIFLQTFQCSPKHAKFRFHALDMVLWSHINTIINRVEEANL